MASFFWQVINWIRGATFLTWLIPALLAGAGLVTWFNSYYEPKGESERLRAQITEMAARLADESSRRKEADIQRQETLAKYRTLNRYMDDWRDRQREIRDDESTAWRGTPIPGPILDGLRDLPFGSEQLPPASP